MPFGSLEVHNEKLAQKIQSMTDKGFVFVAAVGNDGEFFGAVNFPASLSYVISIGSYDMNFNIPFEYSSKGPV